MLDFYDRVLARIAALPGVRGAGAAATVPLGEAWIGLIEIEGRPELKQPIAGYNLVTEGFFETVGVPLRSGRLLTHTDNNGSEPVTVINQAMANRYWPGRIRSAVASEPSASTAAANQSGSGSSAW